MVVFLSFFWGWLLLLTMRDEGGGEEEEEERECVCLCLCSAPVQKDAVVRIAHSVGNDDDYQAGKARAPGPTHSNRLGKQSRHLWEPA